MNNYYYDDSSEDDYSEDNHYYEKEEELEGGAYYDSESGSDYESEYEEVPIEDDQFYKKEGELEGGAYQLDYIDGMYGRGDGGRIRGRGYAGALYGGKGPTEWTKFRKANPGLSMDILREKYKKRLEKQIDKIEDQLEEIDVASLVGMPSKRKYKKKATGPRKLSAWTQYVKDNKGSGKSLSQLSVEYRKANNMIARELKAKVCPPGKSYNVRTNRCRLDKYLSGTRGLSHDERVARCDSKGKIYNPESKRCAKKIYKKSSKGLSLAEKRARCAAMDKMYNPYTNRCNKGSVYEGKAYEKLKKSIMRKKK